MTASTANRLDQRTAQRIAMVSLQRLADFYDAGTIVLSPDLRPATHDEVHREAMAYFRTYLPVLHEAFGTDFGRRRFVTPEVGHD